MAHGSLTASIADFLADLARQGRSVHTLRAYRSDLAAFTRAFDGTPQDITPQVLRTYLTTLATKAPATRARHEASLASFLAWAYRAETINADPMTRLDRTQLPIPAPRPIPTCQVIAVLRAIPTSRDRDRLLFHLIYTTGLRNGQSAGNRHDPPAAACTRHRTGQRRGIPGDDSPSTRPRQRPNSSALRRTDRRHRGRGDPLLATRNHHPALR